MQKAKAHAQRQRKRRVDGDLAQPDSHIIQAQAKVEAGGAELPDEHEAVDAGVEQ